MLLIGCDTAVDEKMYFNAGVLANSILTLLVSGDFCRLLIAFANSLDPDQDRQDVGPDLGPNRLTLL